MEKREKREKREKEIVNGKLLLHYIATKTWDTIKVFGKGVKDGASLHKMVLAFQCPEVFENVKLCIILNGLFFVGIDVIFHYIMMPLLNQFLMHSVPSSNMVELYSNLPSFVFDINNYTWWWGVWHAVKHFSRNGLSLLGGLCRTQTTKTIYSAALTIVFMLLWLLPVYIINILFSGRWYSDIASHAYKVYYVTPPPFSSSSFSSFSPSSSSSFNNVSKQEKDRDLLLQTNNNSSKSIDAILKSVADSIYSLVLISTGMIVQGILFSFLLPWPLNQVLVVLNLSLITSWSAFDMKWAHKGWSFAKKEQVFEKNKLYFSGFGLFTALLTFWSGDFPISSGVWSFLFPFSIISSTFSQPSSVDFFEHPIFSFVHDDDHLKKQQQEQKEQKEKKEKDRGETTMFRVLLVPKAITNFILLFFKTMAPVLWMLSPMFYYLWRKTCRVSKTTTKVLVVAACNILIGFFFCYFFFF